MDLQSVKTKLIHTVNGLSQDDNPVQVDWHADFPSPGQRGRSPAGVEFSTAVEALQWRSVAGGGADAVAADVYAKRLQAMASKINHLSAEQERAIAEMQGIVSQLRRLPGVDPARSPLPRLDLRRVNLAAAEVDAQGNISVVSRPAAAGDYAPDPRSRPTRSPATVLGGQRPGTPASPTAGLLGMLSEAIALGQEPWHIVRALGQWGWQIALVCLRGVGAALSGATSGGTGATRPTLDRWPMLSPVDGCLWFGGGVIGRLALNLLLAAFPILWSVAVAGITAITAYALYRATLAPKLAFGPALRVALLVLGLLVGGQL